MIEYPSATHNIPVYRARILGWDPDSSGAWEAATPWLQRGDPNHPLNAPGLVSTVQANNQLQEIAEWRPLVDQVLDHAGRAWSALVDDQFVHIRNPQLYVIEMWCNWTDPQHWGCGRHDHATPLVATYYPDTLPGAAPLIIYQDADDLEGVEVPIRGGEIVIFPGTLDHRVGFNAMDHRRRAVSINIAWRT